MYQARPSYTFFGLLASSSALFLYNKVQNEMKMPCEIYCDEKSDLNKFILRPEKSTGISQIELMLK